MAAGAIRTKEQIQTYLMSALNFTLLSKMLCISVTLDTSHVFIAAEHKIFTGDSNNRQASTAVLSSERETGVKVAPTQPNEHSKREQSTEHKYFLLVACKGPIRPDMQ